MRLSGVVDVSKFQAHIFAQSHSHAINHMLEVNSHGRTRKLWGKNHILDYISIVVALYKGEI